MPVEPRAPPDWDSVVALWKAAFVELWHLALSCYSEERLRALGPVAQTRDQRKAQARLRARKKEDDAQVGILLSRVVPSFVIERPSLPSLSSFPHYVTG